MWHDHWRAEVEASRAYYDSIAVLRSSTSAIKPWVMLRGFSVDETPDTFTCVRPGEWPEATAMLRAYRRLFNDDMSDGVDDDDNGGEGIVDDDDDEYNNRDGINVDDFDDDSSSVIPDNFESSL